jgi:uncharacterized protein YecE (DUF72 family)
VERGEAGPGGPGDGRVDEAASAAPQGGLGACRRHTGCRRSRRHLYVGTSGWSYPKGTGKWDGIFYPETLADKDKLAYYAQFFNTVELNASFYRPPAASAAKQWVEKTPKDFKFTAKLWQKFTHPKMFKEATGKDGTVADEDFTTFLEGVAPLVDAGKLGPLLAQFPASFKAEPGTFEYLEDLVRRLKAEGIGLAVELRHRSWTESEEAKPLLELMRSQGVAWVQIDEPRFKTSIRNIPVTSKDAAYFRFHGRNYKSWWRHDEAEDRYNYLYSPGETKHLAEDVREVSGQAQDTYAYYNNHHGAKAVVNALELKLMLGERPPEAALPETLVKEYRDLRDILEEYKAKG